MNNYSTPAAAADVIRLYKPNFTPKMGIILGSGLSDFTAQLEEVTIIPYHKIPGFYVPRVEGHAGTLHLGTLKGVPIACFSGRAHYYEVGRAEPIINLIRTIKTIGAEILVQTNAGGSLREEVGPGSLMAITDHISLQYFNPLIGPNDDEIGPRFPSMENAYDQVLREKLKQTAQKPNIDLTEGVYLMTSGPSFETPAEIRAFKMLGVAAVGMSVIPETIIARHCGLKVLAITSITNYAAGMSEEHLSHEQTLRGAKLVIANLIKLLTGFVENF